MSNETQKHSRLSHLPGILAASAALIAAVSTLYVNMHGSPPTPTESAPAPVPPAAPATVPGKVAEAAPEPRPVLVRLDRVQVENDGSVGSTDWTFEVSAAGEPRFTVEMPSLTDKPGHNLARPKDPAQAGTELMLATDQQLKLDVKGWKHGLLGASGAEIAGSAWITGKPGHTAVHVASDKPKSPAFTLYFVVAPRPGNLD